MEQELDIKQQLAGWLLKPESVTKENAPVLKDLALLYPYFQPLHLLIAKATLSSPEQNNNLATAALYTNGQQLHHFLHGGDEQSHNDFNIIHLNTAQSSNQPELIEGSIIEVPSEPMVEDNNSDEQEIFDEIGEVDINMYKAAEANPDTEESPEKEEVDDIVIESIVSADFFAFQDNFVAETVIPDQEHPDFKAEQVPDTTPDSKKEEPVVISKYDDDQLPYTFLWWLAKTRKEHQQIFQPYAAPKKGKQEAEGQQMSTQRPGELQHQYVEHIFHLQSPFSDEEEEYNTLSLRNPTKGDEIIESFIKKDPQISPPKPEQIDNENKAKKSAEDANDLVSETLAKIYIEQMLYDKAIDTYEKLSLKFPEKSRYFADLIQSIEKKI